jgi:hypothetical protein
MHVSYHSKLLQGERPKRSDDLVRVDTRAMGIGSKLHDCKRALADRLATTEGNILDGKDVAADIFQLKEQMVALEGQLIQLEQAKVHSRGICDNYCIMLHNHSALSIIEEVKAKMNVNNVR